MAAANDDDRRWWLYLLACTDGRLYAGIAIDVLARYAAHRLGKGAKFTRANRPVSILAAQSFGTRSEALRAEYALKQVGRVEKLAWAERWKHTLCELSPDAGCARTSGEPALHKND